MKPKTVAPPILQTPHLHFVPTTDPKPASMNLVHDEMGLDPLKESAETIPNIKSTNSAGLSTASIPAVAPTEPGIASAFPPSADHVNEAVRPKVPFTTELKVTKPIATTAKEPVDLVTPHNSERLLNATSKKDEVEQEDSGK